MPPHTAYGIDMEMLDVIVVEDSKPMQTILRSMLSTLRVARIRMFDDAMEALQAMLSEPPHVIISDWHMEPTSGYQLLRMIRHRQMEPLCFVPLVFVTAHGTRAVAEKAFRGGAHYLLVKPMSPNTLHQRLMCLARDSRRFVRRGRHRPSRPQHRRGVRRRRLPDERAGDGNRHAARQQHQRARLGRRRLRPDRLEAGERVRPAHRPERLATRTGCKLAEAFGWHGPAT